MNPNSLQASTVRTSEEAKSFVEQLIPTTKNGDLMTDRPTTQTATELESILTSIRKDSVLLKHETRSIRVENGSQKTELSVTYPVIAICTDQDVVVPQHLTSETIEKLKALLSVYQIYESDTYRRLFCKIHVDYAVFNHKYKTLQDNEMKDILAYHLPTTSR